MAGVKKVVHWYRMATSKDYRIHYWLGRNLSSHRRAIKAYESMVAEELRPQAGEPDSVELGVIIALIAATAHIRHPRLRRVVLGAQLAHIRRERMLRAAADTPTHPQRDDHD